MNYSKNYGSNNTIEVIPCDKCGKARTGRGVTGLCRSCANSLPRNHKTDTTLNRYHDYEPAHLWEKVEFQAYAALLQSVFRKGEWLTIGEIHRRLKKNVIQKWTFDAIEYKGIEKREGFLDFFRVEK
jgi:hypothetical protein